MNEWIDSTFIFYKHVKQIVDEHDLDMYVQQLRQQKKLWPHLDPFIWPDLTHFASVPVSEHNRAPGLPTYKQQLPSYPLIYNSMYPSSHTLRIALPVKFI